MMKHYIDKASHRLIAIPRVGHLQHAGVLPGIAIDRFIDFSLDQQDASAIHGIIDLETHPLGAQSPDPHRDSGSDR